MISEDASDEIVNLTDDLTLVLGAFKIVNRDEEYLMWDSLIDYWKRVHADSN